MPLPFFDVDDFKVINAKFSLDMALAFFNANALRSKNKIKKRVLEMRVLGPLLVYKVLNQFLILLH